MQEHVGTGQTETKLEVGEGYNLHLTLAPDPGGWCPGPLSASCERGVTSDSVRALPWAPSRNASST